jgi:hypothetical protein
MCVMIESVSRVADPDLPDCISDEETIEEAIHNG